MKVNQRDFLGGQSPRERYLQKRRLAVDWIYRYGFTSPPNLRLCMKKESASWASIAVARGLLRSTKTESAEPAVIYALTE